MYDAMWMYIWFEMWNSVCWNDGSVKIVAGPSDHQGKGFSRTDNYLAGQGPRSGAYFSAFEKRSPGRQMRPINAPGDPEPHHRWSGWRLVNSPKFRCWHSSSIVFKLFIGCPNQNLTVFEIARRTGARDQQKQRRSSKTIVYVGPKDQQSVLVFLNSHFPNIVQNMFQSSKQFSNLNSHSFQVQNLIQTVFFVNFM